MVYSNLIFGRMVESIHQLFCYENSGIPETHSCQVGDALRYIYTAKHLLGLEDPWEFGNPQFLEVKIRAK